MTIKIVTDSTCDLPPEVIKQHGITIVPLYVHVDGKDFRDGIDLSRQEFYQRLPEYNPPPTTAAPSPETFRQTYERLAAEGATEILSMHISVSLSSTVNEARIAASETKQVPVTVFDSRQLSLGTGFLLIEAAKAATEGRSMKEILALLEAMIPRIFVAAALDTLEFMRRSGRVSFALAGIGQILQIKPLLKMHDGHPTSEKVRTRAGAIRRLTQLLNKYAPVERIAFIYTSIRERVDELRNQVEALLPEGDMMVTELNPVLGAHVGPRVVGFVCVTKSQRLFIR